MPLEATRNYFELFQLPPMFQLDLDQLESRYREIQGRVHPDKAAHLSDAEKRLFLQWATIANEAYTTLKRPLDRARYLLRIHGIDTREEDNTAMPPEFLLEQIEWREQLLAAVALKSLTALDSLAARLRKEMNSLLGSLATLLDVERRHPAAADVVRQLAFFEKLRRDIELAQTELEE
ncbi:Fe-S protein assembly co-chaperone HscB [Methylocaldum szegediense]|jgi:molecular chaperone HscB|uniref:Co-chaperone protein HscB homolog n=1 Tax=Methylocaldum szegediense TaxID=73780 RepID=A0ABM9HW63_9GAMM|nr:Fe-S protein assembly co-chaperone HscB [Methylocaldum szegediense]CAI8718002.1 Co-chaperone protein HscB homolog [Methylocaldum szegediense]